MQLSLSSAKSMGSRLSRDSQFLSKPSKWSYRRHRALLSPLSQSRCPRMQEQSGLTTSRRAISSKSVDQIEKKRVKSLQVPSWQRKRTQHKGCHLKSTPNSWAKSVVLKWLFKAKQSLQLWSTIRCWITPRLLGIRDETLLTEQNPQSNASEWSQMDRMSSKVMVGNSVSWPRCYYLLTPKVLLSPHHMRKIGMKELSLKSQHRQCLSKKILLHHHNRLSLNRFNFKDLRHRVKNSKMKSQNKIFCRAMQSW